MKSGVVFSFNPAFGLAASKLPYALGNGRLADSNATFSNGVWTFGGTTLLASANYGAGSAVFGPDGSDKVAVGYRSGEGGANVGALSPTHSSWAPLVFSGTMHRFRVSGSEVVRLLPVSALFGTSTDSSNGRIQLATHTTSAGGVGFGTESSLYRVGTRALRANASLSHQVAATTDSAMSTLVDGESTARLSVWGDGKLEWGSGSAARDTTLERTGAGVLRTGGTFNAVTALQVNGITRINTTRPDWDPAGTVGATRIFDDVSSFSGTTASEMADINTKVLQPLRRLIQDLIDIGILQ